MRVATHMQSRSSFRRWLCLGCALLGMTGVAAAHHSAVAAFDLGRHVNVAGTVKKVVLGSPHSEIFLEVLDAAGNAQEWRLEMLAGSKMRQMGWTPQTLPVGDRVQAQGAPSRYEERVLYTQFLQRGDGTRLPLSLVP